MKRCAACCISGLHVPYCLAVTPCSLLPPPPPPPYFLAKLLYRVSLHAPPACRSSRFAVLQFLHVYACCKCRRVVFVYQACRKWFENWSWPFSVTLGRFPEAVILPSRPVGGVWLRKWQHVRGQQLFHPSVLPRQVDRRSSCLLPHYRVREFVEGGGGLNCEAKA